MGPSRDAVENFVACTGEPESTAIEWLMLSDNDPEKAVNTFYDDPGLLEKKKWSNTYDESQFHLDATGQQQSFPVHRQDTLNPNVFNDTALAPTRPPSRVSQVYNGQLSLDDKEQQDIQEAMALSTSQTLPAQETGVTAADKPYFGPSTSEYHDTRNWQMTVSKATAKEIPLDPEPQDRRRSQATPAFLKPTSQGHRLPGLVKILHTIPAAREALLSRRCIQSEYGRDSEWWNGVPIESPHTVYEGVDLVAPEKEIIYEAQRLMAFLDDTDRAYGSSDVLAGIAGIREYQEDPVIEGFLGVWQNAAEHHDPGAPLNNIFSTVGVRTDGETERITHNAKFLNLEVKEDRFVSGQSLYEIIDSTLWPSRDGTEVDGQVFLDSVAEVLFIRVSRGDGVNGGLDVKIPPIWYADRYSELAQPQVHKMFVAKTAAENEIKEVDARKAKISQSNKASNSADTCALLDRAKQYLEKTVQYLEESEGVVPAESTATRSKSIQYSKITDELAKISDRVTRKLQELEESKNTVQARLRELSKLLTEPSDIPEESPCNRYTLRGVCAEPHTVYVQERAEMKTVDDMLNGEAEDWQWWKLHYESNQTTSVSCTKVRQVEVLKAARDESSSAILVYASDKAMSVENKELPPELKSFVENDNSLFAAELASSPGLSSTTTDFNIDNNIDLSLPQKPGNIFRPPPQDRDLRSNHLSNDSSLPSYSSQPHFSSPRRHASYDDYIPTDLRHSSVENDSDIAMDEGVEMMERDDRGGNGRGPLGATAYGTDAGKGYQLGSYEPEIEMEERDDEVKEGEGRW
ncbi:MAG: hypothetical protein Q9221_006130 [Calogaya cf. arnoldii]